MMRFREVGNFNQDQHMTNQSAKVETPETPKHEVPEVELQIDFARSGGPGGQNVNKVNSKAVLKWNIATSAVFNDQEKQLIREKLVNRVNNDDEIVLSADTERSQLQNRTNVIERLNNLVSDALTPQKKRIETKPSRRQKQRRLDDKKLQGRKKQNRRPPPPKEGWE